MEPGCHTVWAGCGWRYRITVPTGRHLELEMKAFETVLPFFFHRKWVLFRAPVGATGFAASDHPVCLMWSDPEQRVKFFPPGHGFRRTQILFPISNELAVMGASRRMRRSEMHQIG
jgi:hypothetical protein